MFIAIVDQVVKSSLRGNKKTNCFDQIWPTQFLSYLCNIITFQHEGLRSVYLLPILLHIYTACRILIYNCLSLAFMILMCDENKTTLWESKSIKYKYAMCLHRKKLIKKFYKNYSTHLSDLHLNLGY